jgi:hypothetical protein
MLRGEEQVISVNRRNPYDQFDPDVRLVSMKNLPIVRLFVYTFSLVAVACGLAFGVCAATGNVPATFVILALCTLIGMIPIRRWWVGVNRAMGVPTTTPTPVQWLIGTTLLGSIALAAVIEIVAYGLTQNRFAEAVSAVCVIVPIGLILVPESYRRMRSVTANELQLSRLNYYSQIGLAIIMSANLVLQLAARHVDPSISGLHEWAIAMYFAYLAIAPFSITFLHRRYLEAKALSDASPPTALVGI